MKLDVVKSLIAVAISVLLAYTCYEICNYEHVQRVIAVGSFITIAIPILLALGVSSQSERSSVMLKALSWIFLLIELISNGVFVFFDIKYSYIYNYQWTYTSNVCADIQFYISYKNVKRDSCNSLITIKL